MPHELSALEIERVIQSLPKNVPQRRLDLLPKVLREWSRHDLPSHLSERFSPKAVARRRKQVEAVEKQASSLLVALDALDEDLQFFIVDKTWPIDQQSTYQAWEDEEKRRRDAFQKVLDFLKDLDSAKPSMKLRKPRGQPPNMVAHLVMLDIAEIFLWATGQRATRRVDRIDGTETGAFFKFAETLWPIVFDGSDAGLKSTMKNWAAARKKFRQRSGVIANMDVRHRSWGLFER